MSAVVYSDPFVPAELIAACGMRPLRLPPSRSAEASFSVSEGLCPYARAFAASVAESEALAVIFTTACDQMRRVCELFTARDHRPCFLLNVPHTWQGSAAFGMYVSELERLGRFLCEIGGHRLSDAELAETMARYAAARQSLLGSRSRFAARQFHEAILAVSNTGLAVPCPESSAANDGIPIAVIGSPLMAGDGELFDLLERFGGRIVLDATDSGEMAMPEAHSQPGAAVLQSGVTVLQTLAGSYWSVPAPFRRPNEGLYAYLDRELSARAVRGMILRRYVWCDAWHAELGRLRQRYPLSVLDLDVSEPLSPHTLTRVEAFLEVLRER
jgi:benzoyl-CoA reductase/2-hydroxyglutaryl-CoA dehydratase subunit BcrC/BadD/HgdB